MGALISHFPVQAVLKSGNNRDREIGNNALCSYGNQTCLGSIALAAVDLVLAMHQRKFLGKYENCYLYYKTEGAFLFEFSACQSIRSTF